MKFKLHVSLMGDTRFTNLDRVKPIHQMGEHKGHNVFSMLYGLAWGHSMIAVEVWDDERHRKHVQQLTRGR